MLVGRLKPVARISFWKTLRVGDVDRDRRRTVVLPAASRARAVSVCAPFGRGPRVPGEGVGGRACPRCRVATPSTIELHAGDADVVGRCRGDVDDVATCALFGRRRDRDRSGASGRRAAAPSARVHVGLDLRRGQGAVVDAHVVDAPGEVEAAVRRAGRCSRSVGESCCVAVTVPTEHAVVELAVEIDVERLRRRVVDARDVVPGVRLQRRRAVAEHLPARAARQLEADGPRASVDRRVELEPDSEPFRLDTIAASSAGNAAELIQALIVMLPVSLQRRRVAEVDEVVVAVRTARRSPYCAGAPGRAVRRACR